MSVLIFLDFVVLFFPSFVVFRFYIISIAHFSMRYPIHTPSLYTPTANIRVSVLFFISGEQFDAVLLLWVVVFFFWFMKFVSVCAVPKYMIELSPSLLELLLEIAYLLERFLSGFPTQISFLLLLLVPLICFFTIFSINFIT